MNGAYEVSVVACGSFTSAAYRRDDPCFPSVLAVRSTPSAVRVINVIRNEVDWLSIRSPRIPDTHLPHRRGDAYIYWIVREQVVAILFGFGADPGESTGRAGRVSRGSLPRGEDRTLVTHPPEVTGTVATGLNPDPKQLPTVVRKYGTSRTPPLRRGAMGAIGPGGAPTLTDTPSVRVLILADSPRGGRGELSQRSEVFTHRREGIPVRSGLSVPSASINSPATARPGLGCAVETTKPRGSPTRYSTSDLPPVTTSPIVTRIPTVDCGTCSVYISTGNRSRIAR